MLVLSEIELELPNSSGIEVVRVTRREIGQYQNKPVQAIVCSRGTAKMIAEMSFPQLSFIQLTSAGFDGVPLDTFRGSNIDVSNAAGIYGIPIAETIVFTMLEVAKKFRKNAENRRPRFLRQYNTVISELYGKKVVILGVGDIGTETAKRLRGFGTTIIGFARSNREKEYFDAVISDKQELMQAIQDAHFVISTLPDSDDTRKFISEEFLCKMNVHGYFINVGRRATLDEDALYRALKSNQIQGAVMDIFEKLPNPVTNKFRRLSNVIVLPGVAAISKEVNSRLCDFINVNLIKVQNNKRPEHVVNGGT